MKRLSMFLPFLFLTVSSTNDLPHYDLFPIFSDKITKDYWKITNIYVNCDYGYYVKLPEGIVGQGTPPPGSNHGFGISLVDKQAKHPFREIPDNYLYVGADHQVLDEQNSLGGIDELYRSFLIADKAVIISRSRSYTNLGGLFAVKIHSVFRKNGSLSIEDQVFALGQSIVYEIDLTIRAANYKESRALFEYLQHNLRIMPIPKGECSNDPAKLPKPSS
jgi:hypothetical protein